MTFLFHEVIFGPVRSRRLGTSLGINLLPVHFKYCSFNCIYCECGWTPMREVLPSELPTRDEVRGFLKLKLEELSLEEYLPDAITFAGNGEPTLHPDFPGIVDDTLSLRDRLAPEARVTVLSNATRVHEPAVFGALLKLDNNIQKLDAGTGKLVNLLNNPLHRISFSDLVSSLQRFNGKVIIQSMFLRGNYRGESVDNTTPGEIEAWLEQLKTIRPEKVMIYSIARATPARGLEKVSRDELNKIADQVKASGLSAEVYD